MRATISGSCFCKEVRYSISSAIPLAVNCHCNSCKKAGGGAFSSLAVVREKHFEILSGKEFLATYQLGEIVTKHFCSRCGTPVFNRNSRYPGRCMVSLGSLDNPSVVVPSVNIHCESRLAWVILSDKIQDFSQGYS